MYLWILDSIFYFESQPINGGGGECARGGGVCAFRYPVILYLCISVRFSMWISHLDGNQCGEKC